jgi:hypothetical protein
VQKETVRTGQLRWQSISQHSFRAFDLSGRLKARDQSMP